MNPATEIRKLYPSNVRELVHILEDADSWKKLMEIIPKRLDKENYECDYNDGNPPKYNSEHFRLIERASRNYRMSCSEILLDEWGTSGRVRPALGHLLHLLKKAEIFRAADFVAIDLLKIPKPKRPKEGPAASVHVTFLLESDNDNETTETIVNDANSSNSNTINDNIERNLPVLKKQVNLHKPINKEVSDMMKFTRSNEQNNESIPENIPKSEIGDTLPELSALSTNSKIIPKISALLTNSEVNPVNESTNSKIDSVNESVNVPNLSALLPNHGVNSINESVNIPKISVLLSNSGDNSVNESINVPNISALLQSKGSADIPQLSALLSEHNGNLPEISALLCPENENNSLPQLSRLLLVSAILHSTSQQSVLPLLSKLLSESENNEILLQSENKTDDLPLISALLSTLKSEDQNDLPLISKLLLSSNNCDSNQIHLEDNKNHNVDTNDSSINETLLQEISNLLKSICNKQTSNENVEITSDEETNVDLLISQKVKKILLSQRLGQYALVPELTTLLSSSGEVSELLNDEIRLLLQKVQFEIENTTLNELKINENTQEETNSLEDTKRSSQVLNKLLEKIEGIVKEEKKNSSLPLISELLKSEFCKDEITKFGESVRKDNVLKNKTNEHKCDGGEKLSELTPAISQLLNSDSEFVPRISGLLSSDDGIIDDNFDKSEINLHNGESSFLPRLSAITGNGAVILENQQRISHDIEKYEGLPNDRKSNDNETFAKQDPLENKECQSGQFENVNEFTPAFSELLKSKECTPLISGLLKSNNTSSNNELLSHMNKYSEAGVNEYQNVRKNESKTENISEHQNLLSNKSNIEMNGEVVDKHITPQIHYLTISTTNPLTPKTSSLLNPNSQTESPTNTSNEISSLNSNSSNRPQCNSPLPNLSLKTILPHFNYYELESATDNFDETPHPKGRFLGSGAFGSVFLCLGLTERPTAVKKLHLDGATEVNVNDTITKQFRNEVELLCSYKHDNLLSICGYSCDGPTYCIIYEYISGGALNYRLENNKEELNWRERLRIACGTAEAVAYLHTAYSRQLIHRDIKTANILLDSANKPKLGDFGIIKLLANKNTTVTTTIIGTSVYMAPESFRSGEVTEKTDTFSFGVVILELLTALPPLDENREARDLITHVEDMCDNETITPLLDLSAGSWIKDERNVAEELFKIANRCLAEKKHRPNMVEVADLLNKLVSC